MRAKVKLAGVMGAAALLTAAGVSVATAAANTTSSGTTYHGCVNEHTRTITDVYTAHTPSCAVGSFPASWNARGVTGATGARGPAGPQGPVVLYDSLVPQGIYSQATNDVLSEFGNAVNLTSNPAGADLNAVRVGLVICSTGCTDTSSGEAASTASITVTLYNLDQGGVVGSPIASVTNASVAVPSVPVGTTQVEFTSLFSFATQAVRLPGTLAYGITINSNPTGNLNIALSPQVSAGSNVYPGDIYASAPSLSYFQGSIPACPNDSMTSSNVTTFQAVPVSCSAAYGGDLESAAGINGTAANPMLQGVDEIPSVELTTTS